MHKKQFRFENVEIGDRVKFKLLNENIDIMNIKDVKETKDNIFSDKDNKDIKDKKEIIDYVTYYGIITDISKTGHIKVSYQDKNKEQHNNFIDRRSVMQIYTLKLIEHLTPRLTLKHLWKDLVFREVKTTKNANLLYADYHYVNSSGFERIRRFSSLNEAYSNISSEYHKNIVPYYDDFFGFTMDKAIRNNDHYYDHEIFFSKKCYCELDWSSNPTGDFIVNRKKMNLTSPIPDTLICGIVENGEKGLFFRKWFVCSKEFFTLWTMVCDPNDDSLKEPSNIIDDEIRIKGEWIKKGKREKKVKSLDKLLQELDTSCYSIDMKANISERRKKYGVYNMETTALYYPNRYKQIAEVLFSNGFLADRSGNSYTEEFTSFQKKLIKNLLWSKRL